jgi:hypothetical protein
VLAPASQHGLSLTPPLVLGVSFTATDAECACGSDRNRPRPDNDTGAFGLPSRRE